jgi:hypothetical protein
VYDNSSPAYEKFKDSLLASIRSELLSKLDKADPAAYEQLSRIISGKPLLPIQTKPSEQDKYRGLLYTGFFEIDSSYQAHHDVQEYIRRFPFGTTAITRGRYLRFVIEAYLNEIYILSVRLQNYLNGINKHWRISRKCLDVARLTQQLASLVSQALEPVIKTRGSHVHSSRYKDPNLHSVEALELLALAQGDERAFWELLYVKTYKTVRKDWLKTVRANNTSIGILLDKYFKTLHPLVFDAHSKISYPA